MSIGVAALVIGLGVAVAVLLGAIAAWALHALRDLEDKAIERDVREFVEMFPDRCLPCSMDRFGRENGLIPPSKPKQRHCCPEEDGDEQPE